MIAIPDNTLIAIADHPAFDHSVRLIVEPLKGKLKREWFIHHAYFCLPLTIGNQYGFAIRSLKKIRAVWNGGDQPSDTQVEIMEESDMPAAQTISSHFGMGVITIQNRFTFRTPPGINLMTINPPNCWIDGIHHMTGVIETDNLRRDFTFNLKVTRKNTPVMIEKGEYIGCVLPIPRYFVDGFQFLPAHAVLTTAQIRDEQEACRKFGVERSTVDINKPHGNGRRYFNGEDIDGALFWDHQKKVE
jgi:hypothetical protein